MAYDVALNKAWNAITNLAGKKAFTIRMLSETYTVDPVNITITRNSDNSGAKDYVDIILLHYLAKKLESKKLPCLTGEWINFTQLEGGKGYYPAFKKRVIDRIAGKYGFEPEKLLRRSADLPAKKANAGDIGIIVDALDGVPVMITMWKPDDEFGPCANILFDRSIKDIFCTEDIVVLSEILAHSL